MECSYHIRVHALQASSHGVPQHRPRLFLVGRRRNSILHDYEEPAPLPSVFIEAVLDDDGAAMQTTGSMSGLTERESNLVKHALANLNRQGVDLQSQEHVVDVDASESFCAKASRVAPCLLAARSRGLWLLKRGRRLSLFETARLLLEIACVSKFARNMFPCST